MMVEMAIDRNGRKSIEMAVNGLIDQMMAKSK
jgi:hypothetical protein